MLYKLTQSEEEIEVTEETIKPIEHKEMLQQLMDATAEVLKVEEVDPSMPLSDMGIDSLNVVEVIIACEEIYSDFNIDPSELEFDELTTLVDMHNQMISFELI